MKDPLYIEWVGLSDPGLVRLKNEDCFALSKNQTCFFLADGMGGHPAGEIAATETVSFLCDRIDKLCHPSFDLHKLVFLIQEGVQAVNEHIFSLGREKPYWKGMGTTLCLAFFTSSHLIYTHVGDSRIYKIQEKKELIQLTQDHSLRAELLASGLEKSSAKLPPKHVITRAIGTRKTVKAQIEIIPLQKEDLYLMCSDGLTDQLTSFDLLQTIQQHTDLDKIAHALLEQAKEKGGKDNITLLLLKPHLHQEVLLI